MSSLWSHHVIHHVHVMTSSHFTLPPSREHGSMYVARVGYVCVCGQGTEGMATDGGGRSANAIDMFNTLRTVHFTSVLTTSLLLSSRGFLAAHPARAAMSTFHELKGTDIDGTEISFSKFQDKVVYITNVASA